MSSVVGVEGGEHDGQLELTLSSYLHNVPLRAFRATGCVAVDCLLMLHVNLLIIMLYL